MSDGNYLKRWAHAYVSRKSYWGKQTSSLVRRVPQAESGAETAYDLGCGQGRNTVALVDLGYRVFAVDVLVESFQSFASASGRHEQVCADAAAFMQGRPDGEASVILANHLIQHLGGFDQTAGFCSQCIDKLRAGGIFCAAYFTQPAGIHPEYVQASAFLPEQGEVFAFLDAMPGIERLMHQWEIRTDDHDGDEPHQHAVERVIFRKV